MPFICVSIQIKQLKSELWTELILFDLNKDQLQQIHIEL